MPAKAKLPPGEGKRVPLNMRTTREVRTKLELVAADSGRSLVQEVEHRLEQSFKEDESVGGMRLRALLLLFGTAARLVEHETGKSLFEDWNTWVAVQAAWRRLGVQFGTQPSKKYRKALEEKSNSYVDALSLGSYPKDAASDVRAAWLRKLLKVSKGTTGWYGYEENDRLQKAIGEEIVASLLALEKES